MCANGRYLCGRDFSGTGTINSPSACLRGDSMSEYRPPVDEMLFILDSVAGMGAVAELPGCEMATAELARSVMDEAGELASNVLAPLNAEGDQAGADVRDGQVHVPESFRPGLRGVCRRRLGAESPRRRPTAGRDCRRFWRSLSRRCGSPPTWPCRCARC